MKQAHIIIKVTGKDDEALDDALIEVVKNIVNESGACGTGRNSQGTTFEFSTLHSDIKNRRGAFERALSMQTGLLDMARDLLAKNLVVTIDEEAAHADIDKTSRERINAKIGESEARELTSDQVAAELGRIFGAILSDLEGKGTEKPKTQH